MCYLDLYFPVFLFVLFSVFLFISYSATVSLLLLISSLFVFFHVSRNTFLTSFFIFAVVLLIIQLLCFFPRFTKYIFNILFYICRRIAYHSLYNNAASPSTETAVRKFRENEQVTDMYLYIIYHLNFEL